MTTRNTFYIGGYPLEFWVGKVLEGRRNDYRAPEPTPEPVREPRTLPPLPVTDCRWDIDGREPCMKCRRCSEDFYS